MIKSFNSYPEAVNYSSKLGKYESELVRVNNKNVYLSSTSIPIEERFRNPVEEMVSNFLTELGIIDQREIDDISMFIGAKICNEITDEITKMTDVQFLSLNLDY